MFKELTMDEMMEVNGGKAKKKKVKPSSYGKAGGVSTNPQHSKTEEKVARVMVGVLSVPIGGFGTASAAAAAGIAGSILELSD